MDGLLTHASALRGAHVGVLAVETASGRVLYTRAADDAFQPASTLKLLVGSVALDRLGPAFTFHTEALVAGSTGYLRGGGDPFLRSQDLRAAAVSLATAGVSADTMYVDATHDDSKPYPEGWVWDDFGYDYAVPISALTVDGNLRSLAVRAGASPGSPVLVDDPRALAARMPCPAAGPAYVVAATTGVAGSANTLDTQTLAPQCVALVGSLPLGASASLDVATLDPARDAWAIVHAALVAQAAGAPLATPLPVPVTAAASGAPVFALSPEPLPASIFASAPADAHVVWAHASPPLAAFLGPRFWIPSDNHVAELLLEEVGSAATGRAGSTASGLEAERSWLRALPSDPGTATLADGSGLSQYDRISPRMLVAILQHDWHGPHRQLVLDALPVGGARGTIEGIAGTSAAGRTFAKTGSMSHVRGLAGYLATRRHGAVTFAFSVDDWNGDYEGLAAVRARVLARLIDD